MKKSLVTVKNVGLHPVTLESGALLRSGRTAAVTQAFLDSNDSLVRVPVKTIEKES